MNDDLNQTHQQSVVTLRGAERTGLTRDLSVFEQYWSNMRCAGDVPLRSAIDPRGIETLLANAFIAEKVTPGLARLRIAGTHLSDLMGMEVRGMPLSSLIQPSHRTTLSDAMVDLFERPAKIMLELQSPGGVRRGALNGAMVILPLRSDLGDISRALGCLMTSGPIGVSPRRFEITHCRIVPIDLAQVRTPTGPAAPQVQTPALPAGLPHKNPMPPYNAQDTGDRDRDTDAPPRHSSERPYLRLVQND